MTSSEMFKLTPTHVKFKLHNDNNLRPRPPHGSKLRGTSLGGILQNPPIGVRLNTTNFRAISMSKPAFTKKEKAIEKIAEVATHMGRKMGKKKLLMKKQQRKEQRVAMNVAPAAVSYHPKVFHNRANGKDESVGCVPLIEVILPSSSGLSKLYSAYINPMNSAMFPELAREASNYEECDLQCTFTFYPGIGSQVGGQLYQYVDPDAGDAVVQDTRSLMYQQNKAVGLLWEKQKFVMPKSKVNPRKYCAPFSTAPADVSTARMNSFGIYYLFASGVPNTAWGGNAGWVFCTYKAKFYNRKTPQPVSVCICPVTSGTPTNLPTTAVPLGWINIGSNAVNGLMGRIGSVEGFDPLSTYALSKTISLTVSGIGAGVYPLVSSGFNSALSPTGNPYTPPPAIGTLYNAFPTVPGNRYHVSTFFNVIAVPGIIGYGVIGLDPNGVNTPVVYGSWNTVTTTGLGSGTTIFLATAANPVVALYMYANATGCQVQDVIFSLNLHTTNVLTAHSMKDEVKLYFEEKKEEPVIEAINTVSLADNVTRVSEILGVDPNARIVYQSTDEKYDVLSQGTSYSVVPPGGDYIGHPKQHRAFLKGGCGPKTLAEQINEQVFCGPCANEERAPTIPRNRVCRLCRAPSANLGVPNARATFCGNCQRGYKIHLRFIKRLPGDVMWEKDNAKCRGAWRPFLYDGKVYFGVKIPVDIDTGAMGVLVMGEFPTHSLFPPFATGYVHVRGSPNLRAVVSRYEPQGLAEPNMITEHCDEQYIDEAKAAEEFGMNHDEFLAQQSSHTARLAGIPRSRGGYTIEDPPVTVMQTGWSVPDRVVDERESLMRFRDSLAEHVRTRGYAELADELKSTSVSAFQSEESEEDRLHRETRVALRPDPWVPQEPLGDETSRQSSGTM
jgi:hypothetical protein